jgi:hypothetical protein
VSIHQTAGPLEQGIWGRIDRPGWATLIILLVHGAAACLFLPPTCLVDGLPLLNIDYAHHWHFAYIYEQAARQGMPPWGYDPLTLPGQWIDLSIDSSRPYELLALLVGPTLGVKLFIYLGIVAAPLCVYAGCRAFDVRAEYRVWILLAAVVTIWLTNANNFMLTCGLMPFFTAVYGSFLSLALFCRFAYGPTPGRFALFVLSSSLTFFLHPFAPVIIFLPLVLLTLLAPALRVRWRIASISSPVLIATVNAFWLVPMLASAILGSRPEWEPVHPMILKGNMTFADWPHFVKFISQPHQLAANILGFLFVAYGTTRIVPSDRKLIRVALVATWLTLLVIYWCGSFIGPLRLLQPNRFGMPYRLFLLVLAIPACVDTLRWMRLPLYLTAGVAIVVVAVFVTAKGKLLRLPRDPHAYDLLTYVREETRADDRIAVQMRDDEDFACLALPGFLGREILSTCYPNVIDPIQFTSSPFYPVQADNVFLGRKLGAWNVQDLKESLERFGISVVITRSDDWEQMLEKVAGPPVARRGPYAVYRVFECSERFLVGSGHVHAAVNRLKLSDLAPENGRVVIKYRYHPGWTCVGGCQIRPYKIPNDRYGFIEVVNPPKDLDLTFEPWRAIFAPWPVREEVSN